MTGDETQADEQATARRDRRRSRGTIAVVLLAALLVAGAVYAGVAASTGRATATPTDAVTASVPGDASSSPAASASPGATPTDGPDDGDGSDSDRTTLPPVGLDDSATVADGVQVRVAQIESVTGEAVLPGEIGGPALRITVEVRNDSDATIDLRTATVTAAYGDPVQHANPISKPEGKAFENEVSPGQSATGVFVFEVPADQRGYVRVDVDLSVDQPIVAFEGAVG